MKNGEKKSVSGSDAVTKQIPATPLTSNFDHIDFTDPGQTFIDAQVGDPSESYSKPITPEIEIAIDSEKKSVSGSDAVSKRTPASPLTSNFDHIDFTDPGGTFIDAQVEDPNESHSKPMTPEFQIADDSEEFLIKDATQMTQQSTNVQSLDDHDSDSVSDVKWNTDQPINVVEASTVEDWRGQGEITRKKDGPCNLT